MFAMDTTSIQSLDTVMAKLRQQRQELRGMGVVSIAVFGSRARGDNRQDSDLDLLIDYDRSRKFSLLDLVRVERALADELQMDVQITTRDSVPEQNRQRIDAESVAVF